MAILEKLKNWYRGRPIPPPANDPNSRLIFLSLGRFEQPALAKLLGKLGRFYLAHWQWIIGTAIAIIAIIVTL